MGCAVEQGYDGTELDVHQFDTKERGAHYLTVGRGYTFDRHEPWGFTDGVDLYQGPTPGARASLRKARGGYWTVTLWGHDRG